VIEGSLEVSYDLRIDAATVENSQRREREERVSRKRIRGEKESEKREQEERRSKRAKK
jgi:hypothetical protein